MSKMSQLHAELTEQAAELGFKSIEDAEQHGYIVEYKGGRLVPTEELMKQAHEAWLADKEVALEGLDDLLRNLKENNGEAWKLAVVEFAINFIKKGEA